MKKSLTNTLMLLVALLLTSCSAAFYAQSNSASNDLYAIHNRTEIARKQQAEAEARKAEAEARRAEIEALILEREVQQLSERATTATTQSRSVNYQSVLADDYQSAYARRLRGFESPSYRMPSSYTNARYSSTFHYVSAYDPAFYNIIVMGDEVWVEPKYVTAMFGNWGAPVYHSAWYYGWSVPSFSLGFGSWGWNVGLSWYDPWYFSSWHNSWWGWYGPHWWGHGIHHPHWYPGWHAGGHRPIYGGGHYGRPTVHRPSASRYTQPYGGSSRNAINRAQSGNRNWSSGAYQGSSRPEQGRGSGTVSRQPSQQREQNNMNSNNSWNTNNSTRRSSSSGYSGSSNSYGGSRSSGSSGLSGGGARGGYSGSSSRSR